VSVEHDATPCNTLRRTTTHCKILPHIETH